MVVIQNVALERMDWKSCWHRPVDCCLVFIDQVAIAIMARPYERCSSHYALMLELDSIMTFLDFLVEAAFASSWQAMLAS